MVNLKELEKAIRRAWKEDTCYPPWRGAWSEENPAWGHCAVTSLVVQDYFRGDIVYCKHEAHFWNMLPRGESWI